MIGYFVIILLAAGSVLAAALFFRHRQKQVMDGLSDMLEAAINGTFSETTFMSRGSRRWKTVWRSIWRHRNFRCEA